MSTITQNKVATEGDVPQVTPGAEISAQTFQDMLDVLAELVDHTHVYYDDYSTACNCNCNCACSRGIL